MHYGDWTIGEEIPAIGSGWDQPPLIPVKRVLMHLSEIGVDLEEGVDTAQEIPFLEPSEVVRRPELFSGDISVVPDEVPTIESGWELAPPPAVIKRLPVYFGDYSLGEDIPVIESGWEMSTPPSVVRRIPVYFGDYVLGEEIALIESGWDQTPTSPVVLRVPLFPSLIGIDIEQVPVVEGPGWDQAFASLPVLRVAFYPNELGSDAVLLTEIAAAVFAARRLMLN